MMLVSNNLALNISNLELTFSDTFYIYKCKAIIDKEVCTYLLLEIQIKLMFDCLPATTRSKTLLFR